MDTWIKNVLASLPSNPPAPKKDIVKAVTIFEWKSD